MNRINTINTINFNDVTSFASNDAKVFLMVVTPDIAKEMLATSKGNRKLNRLNIVNLQREMENGEYDWRTGESIKFDINGAIKDGHHRLKAVIESGIPQTMLIFVGAKSIEKMDTGKSRSMADSLTMSENGNLKDISKLAVNVLRIKNGKVLSNTGYKKEFSITEVINFCEEKEDILNQIIADIKLNKKSWINRYNKTEPSVIGAIIYEMVYMNGYDYAEVIDFTNQILSYETSNNTIINKFRKSTNDDSKKTSKNGAWTFEEFRARFHKTFVKSRKAQMRMGA